MYFDLAISHSERTGWRPSLVQDFVYNPDCDLVDRNLNFINGLDLRGLHQKESTCTLDSHSAFVGSKGSAFYVEPFDS